MGIGLPIKIREDSTDYHESVLDEINMVTSEPAAPSVGDRYINSATGTSSGTSQSVTANYIYEWNGSSWDEEEVDAGGRCFDANAGYEKTFDGTTWYASSQLINLYGSVAGTANQVTVTDDGDGTITLATPQDIATTSSPTFDDVILTDGMTCSAASISASANLGFATAVRLLATDASKNVESTDLASWVTGTADEVTVLDNGDGTITLGAPQALASGSSPTFANITIDNTLTASAANFSGTVIVVSDINLFSLTASRPLALDASKNIESTTFATWIDGTADQVNVADDGDGSVTLSLPQSLASGSSPTFANLTIDNTLTAAAVNLAGAIYAPAATISTSMNLDYATASRLLATDASKNAVSSDLSDWVTGTADQVTVTDDTDGTITLALPQSLASGSSPTFNDLTLDGSLNVAQEMIWGGTSVAHGASPYSVLATDKIIDADVSGGVLEIDLPAATGTGRIIIVNDVAGNCNNQNITIDPNGSEQINSLGSGAAYTMTTAHQCSWFRDVASGQWSIIAEY